MVEITNEQLIEQARVAWSRAYARYSHYKVGAALLTKDGKIILGCNVENSSYGGTICAERSAIVSAVSQGIREFEAIAIVVDADQVASPCGICRQFLVEFGNYKVVLGTIKTNDTKVTSTYELLPYAFTPSHLDEFDKVNGHNKERQQDIREVCKQIP